MTDFTSRGGTLDLNITHAFTLQRIAGWQNTFHVNTAAHFQFFWRAWQNLGMRAQAETGQTQTDE
jgi:hypothetical protein